LNYRLKKSNILYPDKSIFYIPSLFGSSFFNIFRTYLNDNFFYFFGDLDLSFFIGDGLAIGEGKNSISELLLFISNILVSIKSMFSAYNC